MLSFLSLLILALTVVQSQPDTNSPPSKEFIASKAHRMELLLLDRELNSNLEEYIEELQSKIEVLQRFAEMFRTPLEEAKGREEEYLSNPLHSFRLIRHMHEDWRHVEKFMRQPVGKNQIKFIKGKAKEFPLKEDAEEATEAFYRIIRTYDVRGEDLVHGLIDGVRYNGSISAIDFYSLGALHFQWGEYDKAAQFLSFCLDLVEPEYHSMYNVLGFASSEVFLLLARCFMEMDQEEYARRTLMSHPDLAEHSEPLLSLFTNKKHAKLSEDLQRALPEEFNQICRSSHQNKPSRLHCRYNATSSPFLRLAPLRMEELSLDPYIVVYHNVLSDAEIAEIKRIGEPLLIRAGLGKKNTNQNYKVRTALGAWMPDDKMDASGWPVLHRIFRRIRDMTGLIMNSHQFLQLIKYGFGGHYDRHFDFINGSFPITQGDRMATVLFYLSDARHGGSTIFTHLKLKVPAERGKVLFWYNMRGETHDLDTRTIHGACPVIDGTKTVLSCWIHEFDQMFIQPTYRPGGRVFPYSPTEG
ncbi:prolyl 4-hydroxylase subunit alpha-2-like [Drosophila guanche]|uniref:procollagen-proline 4-dioxygenase n=1 Tax=Drosophila guanche TaxID=7266 RepID=A0A3B0K4F7_DROGU|nr:prolyl 4-hydroxylase subunit alpha-2-like [Drosophila guanche]SPP80889.1 blast:Prolyl 4-hydroxylase subunit alpha-2 [Drosophila guanche]